MRCQQNWTAQAGEKGHTCSMESHTIHVTIQPDAPCPCLSGSSFGTCCGAPGAVGPHAAMTAVPRGSGFNHPSCYASALGGCSPKITGEHVISHGALKVWAEGPSIEIGGFVWMREGEAKSLPTSALTAKRPKASASAAPSSSPQGHRADPLRARRRPPAQRRRVPTAHGGGLVVSRNRAVHRCGQHSPRIEIRVPGDGAAAPPRCASTVWLCQGAWFRISARPRVKLVQIWRPPPRAGRGRGL